jgi:hypothetical protein
MLTSRTRRLSLLTLLAAALAAATLAPTASAAAQRYASPTGSGTDCSSANPCSLREAVEKAHGGDEVIVNPGPGEYELTATLKTPYPMTIHGVAGQPRPRLRFKGLGQGLQVLGSTLRYVEVVQDPGNDWWALYAYQSSIDQVIAKGSGWVAAEVSNSVIRNSIVVSSHPNGGVALQTGSNGANSNSTYRNVTAIATTGWAIRAWANTDSTNILARNVIARSGPGVASLRARAVNPGTSATITVDHSNWSGKLIEGNASIVDGGGSQSAAPAFVDAAAGDYRQAPGSPTIDAGLDEFINGDFDVDGDPRQIGPTDIGADEFFVAPAVTTGPAGAVTEQSATLSGSVNPNGVSTAYWFEYGPTTAYGSNTLDADAGSGTGAVAATATLGGLSPATTYHYRLVANNSGVSTKGADQTFTTASPPPPPMSPPPTSLPPTSTPPTSPPPTSPPPTTPAFAGVRLVSTKLTFGGRFLTLKLSCAAATVGRCTGQTKLTTRRRRSGARAAATVGLGRARFSIAAGKQARVRLRVSRAGRRLLHRTPRLRGRATSAARDSAGRSKTTVAKVSIRRRQH